MTKVRYSHVASSVPAARSGSPLLAAGDNRNMESQFRLGDKVRFVGGGRFDGDVQWQDGDRLHVGDEGIIADINHSVEARHRFSINFPMAFVRLSAADIVPLQLPSTIRSFSPGRSPHNSHSNEVDEVLQAARFQIGNLQAALSRTSSPLVRKVSHRESISDTIDLNPAQQQLQHVDVVRSQAEEHHQHEVAMQTREREFNEALHIEQEKHSEEMNRLRELSSRNVAEEERRAVQLSERLSQSSLRIQQLEGALAERDNIIIGLERSVDNERQSATQIRSDTDNERTMLQRQIHDMTATMRNIQQEALKDRQLASNRSLQVLELEKEVAKYQNDVMSLQQESSALRHQLSEEAIRASQKTAAVEQKLMRQIADYQAKLEAKHAANPPPPPITLTVGKTVSVADGLCTLIEPYSGDDPNFSSKRCWWVRMISSGEEKLRAPTEMADPPQKHQQTRVIHSQAISPAPFRSTISPNGRTSPAPPSLPQWEPTSHTRVESETFLIGSDSIPRAYSRHASLSQDIGLSNRAK